MGLGFKDAGYEIVGAYDFDKYAVESYRENVGDHVQQADIKDMTWQDVPKAKVWTFGFPCQDLSVAGKQAGMELECFACGNKWQIDPEAYSHENKCPECDGTKHKSANRSGLFFEMMRLLDETQANQPENMPKVLVAENVKGLKKFIGVLKAEFQKRGYEAHIELYNSKYWGVPQNRERYFIAGIRDGEPGEFKMPAENKDPKLIPKLSEVLETNVDEKYYISDEKAQSIIQQALKRLEKLGKVHATITPDRIEKRQNGRRAKEEEEILTLTAQDLHGVIIDDNYGIVEEIAKETGLMHADGIGRTLRVGGDGSLTKKHNYQHIIEEPRGELQMLGMLDMKGNECIRRVYDPEGISPTLTTSQGGHRQPKILEPIFPVPEATKKGYAVAEVGDSINISHINSKTRRGRIGKEVAQTLLTGCEQVTLCPTTYRVRKLTPTEYGRLQAFPMDNWKQVVSDSQAYKQFGNAVTTTVAKAVAESIKEVIDRDDFEEEMKHIIESTRKPLSEGGLFNPTKELQEIIEKKKTKLEELTALYSEIEISIGEVESDINAIERIIKILNEKEAKACTQ